ncbi:Argininosuccinate synthase [Caldivirga maquilingensis IC-167]|uniref:Argininosuccinate synthase n=1 Tax=Caldivirga maquilingensis (strain ATCC 700844 / DSM 13496 / JCM 10307 / IC-167) TaxID=397948 RepID=A8MCU4_CALMQ|nr:Argininosuccinate synthase [Caldivirga maquilingensis IC-167]
MAIHWLKSRFNAEVVTVTVNVGQEDDFSEIENRAYKLGVLKHYTIDARDDFANGPIASAIMLNALYEDKYPLGTALARPLIAEKVIEVARREGCDAIAHGSTSKGNDQVRFEEAIKAMAPDLTVIAPARIWGMDRKTEVEYARRNNIPIPEVHSRFSIDDNLWTRSIEGPELDDSMVEPPEDAFKWTINPSKVNESLKLEIEFKNGVPVAVNGEKMKLSELILALNRLVGSHGYGRVDHVENRVVGFKSREVYEAPAALTLIEAHRDLEKLIYTPIEYRFKRLMDQTWTDLIYQGLWHEPLRIELEEAAKAMNKWVTGVVKVTVRGGLMITGRSSPYASYSKEIADYVKGWYPSDEEARGFISMWTLHSLTAYRVRWGSGVS